MFSKSYSSCKDWGKSCLAKTRGYKYCDENVHEDEETSEPLKWRHPENIFDKTHGQWKDKAESDAAKPQCELDLRIEKELADEYY